MPVIPDVTAHAHIVNTAGTQEGTKLSGCVCRATDTGMNSLQEWQQPSLQRGRSVVSMCCVHTELEDATPCQE